MLSPKGVCGRKGVPKGRGSLPCRKEGGTPLSWGGKMEGSFTVSPMRRTLAPETFIPPRKHGHADHVEQGCP